MLLKAMQNNIGNKKEKVNKKKKKFRAVLFSVHFTRIPPSLEEEKKIALLENNKKALTVEQKKKILFAD